MLRDSSDCADSQDASKSVCDALLLVLDELSAAEQLCNALVPDEIKSLVTAVRDV